MSGSRRRPARGPGRAGGGGGKSGGGRPPGRRTGPSLPTPVPTPSPAPDGFDRPHDAGEDRLVRDNRRRAWTIAMVAGLVPGVVVAAVVAAVGLPVGAGAAFVVVVAGVAWGMWRTAPNRVVKALGARPSTEPEHPRLHNLVDGLCASMGLPRPALFVVDHAVPNALAVGRDPSTARLVVTSGLEASLSLVQLEGVLAHELVHVKRGDIVLTGMAAAALAPWSLVVGVARATDQVHTLVGRGREFAADQRAAAVLRYPPGIGSALEAMSATPASPASWPPGGSRTAALTRWLWIDPVVGEAAETAEGNLDDTRVRAEALSLT